MKRPFNKGKTCRKRKKVYSKKLRKYVKRCAPGGFKMGGAKRRLKRASKKSHGRCIRKYKSGPKRGKCKKFARRR